VARWLAAVGIRRKLVDACAAAETTAVRRCARSISTQLSGSMSAAVTSRPRVWLDWRAATPICVAHRVMNFSDSRNY